MSPSLTYRPAYIGLFSALVLAIACNAFLDIQYGSFGPEVLFWAGVFAYTLKVGWSQRGVVGEIGPKRQKIVLGIGILLSVVVFIPMWGFPRAGLYMLAVLQAAMNCVTTTRRSLHFGLLVSVVMVLFAATHYRAGWTMLFYLVPYVTAVVFTLVAEQISRRAQDLQQGSLGPGSGSGQGAAIVSATAIILLGGALLYAITPQVSWPYLVWKYGQPGSLVQLGESPDGGQQGQNSGKSGTGGAAGEGLLQDSSSGANDGSGMLPRSGWPTPKEMREAARQPGMPKWQSSAISRMADLAERIDMAMTPIRLGLDELWKDLKEWLAQHRQEISQSLIAMIILAMLLALWRLFRETRPMVWLLAHLDFFRLGLFKRHHPGNSGAYQYYRALERLFDLHGVERRPATNTREYLMQVGRQYGHLQRDVAELTSLFERARYGSTELAADDLTRMRENYRQIYYRIDKPHIASEH